MCWHLTGISLLAGGWQLISHEKASPEPKLTPVCGAVLVPWKTTLVSFFKCTKLVSASGRPSQHLPFLHLQIFVIALFVLSGIACFFLAESKGSWRQ